MVSDFKNSFSVEVISNDAVIKRTYFQVVKKVLDINKKLIAGKLTFSYGGRPVRAVPADIIRVISQSKFLDKTEECQRNLLLNAVISLEKMSVFSGLTFLSMFEQKDEMKGLGLRLRASEEEMFYLVRKKIGTGMCYEIFELIYKNAGLFSDICFVETKDRQKFHITTEGGRLVDGSLHMLFENPPKDIKRPCAVFVDGIIEKVSEIHRILEESSQEQKEVIIFSHGFSADVVNTLSENFKTGKLKVIPFIVNDRENCWKIFEEINVQTVRRENFKHISMLSLSDISELESVNFEKDKCVIQDGSIENLKTHVFIPSHFKNQSGLIEDRVRSAIRYSQDISKYGVVLSREKEPVDSFLQRKTASKAFSSFNKTVQNTGCIVSHSR